MSQDLRLGGNQISDPGMVSLADAISRGSMANLQKLYLHNNQTGDAGMVALAGAMGALDKLTVRAAAHLPLSSACRCA